jgi:hypothetical protein
MVVWRVAPNVSRSVAVAVAGVTSTETTRNFRNEPHTAARLTRKTPTHPISQIFAKACRSLAACNGVHQIRRSEHARCSLVTTA